MNKSRVRISIFSELTYKEKRKKKSMCICQILCILSNRLYIVKYKSSRSGSDLCSISLKTIKVNVHRLRAIRAFLIACVLCLSLLLADFFDLQFGLWFCLDSMLPKSRPQFVQTRFMSVSLVEGQEYS